MDFKKKEVKKMAVFTAKCKRAFIVAPDRSKPFLGYTENTKSKSKTDKLLSKITAKAKTDDK